MKNIIKTLEKKGKYEPYHLKNSFYRIFFTKKGEDYFIIIDKEKRLLNDLMKIKNISEERIIRNNFKYLDKKLIRYRIESGGNDYGNNIYLSISSNSFIISINCSSEFIILKEYPFEEKTYLECFERNLEGKESNVFIMFGNKISYYKTFLINVKNTISFLNFYQDGIQKLNLYNVEKEEL